MYTELAGHPIWQYGVMLTVAILAGIAAARLFTRTPEQAIIAGKCPQCGEPKLLLTPLDRNHVAARCGSCAAFYILENKDPVDDPVFEPVKVRRLGMFWSDETGNPIFDTGEGRAEFDVSLLEIAMLAETRHPREALQRLVDFDIKPFECECVCRNEEGDRVQIVGDEAWPLFLESAGVEKADK